MAHLPHDHGERAEQALAEMPAEQQFQSAADLFKLLDDVNRTRIFWVLCHCEECVVNLAALVGMTSPAVSHHLRQLKDGGLIVSRRVGREVHYKAADTRQAQLLHIAIEQAMRLSCPAPEALDGALAPLRPDEEARPACEEGRAALARRIRDDLTQHLERHVTIEELARRYAINTSSLKAAFKEAYGVPVAAYVKQCRMRRAMALLARTDGSVAAVARQVGYGSQGKFARAFRQYTGASPTAWRRQQADGEGEKMETDAKSGANDRNEDTDVL